jgi:hypothetical protein
MALVNFTNLDFDQIKTSIKDYLRSNSNFTDYDFEGSNLSTIIDVLAYNTYITAYNANMISNELFIDGATLRENVVALARNIGYIPRSRTSSKATVSFFVDVSNLRTPPLTLTLLKGTVCTSSTSFGDSNYTFCIPDDITVPVSGGYGTFSNINVYEGSYVVSTFTVNSNNPNQRFILNNPHIDTKSIRVRVRNTQESSLYTLFNIKEDITTINSQSNVCFLQEIEDQRYELIFGDGIFGKKLKNLNYIEVSYFVTNGIEANKIDAFTYSGKVIDNNRNTILTGISLVSTNQKSQGGSEIESVNSIKKYAPRIYSTQNRAVTALDYESIIPKIYPDAESVSVFGGEDLNPPQYGKVFITIKPVNGAFVPNTIKDNIRQQIKKYNVAGIVVEILDLKYLYIEFNSTVYFDSNTSEGSNKIKSIILKHITTYSDSPDMNKYGARFKYSKFLKLIDDSDSAITSNITILRMRRDLTPQLNKYADYEICFGNPFYVKCADGYNIKSSGFNISGIIDTLYLGDIPNSNRKKGKIFFFKLNAKKQPVIVRNNVGTIDYVKGEIKLSPVNITNTVKLKGGEHIIEISANPQSNDIIGLQDLYLNIDINHSSVNMLPDSVVSGYDHSGSVYKITSSYATESYTR